MRSRTDCGWFRFRSRTGSRRALIAGRPSRRLDTAPATPDPDHESRAVPPKAWTQLYTYNFASVTDNSCRPVLTVSFLLWAPLTKDVKNSALAESKAPTPQEFAEATKGFIRDYLGDVVLYGGTFRDNVMRPSLQAALCRVTGAKPSPDGKSCTPGPYNDPTIIITHSLGGYMLIDTMDNELRSKNCNQTASGKILANTDYVFMMANQVALLDLTTLRNYPPKLGARAA